MTQTKINLAIRNDNFLMKMTVKVTQAQMMRRRKKKTAIFQEMKMMDHLRMMMLVTKKCMPMKMMIPIRLPLIKTVIMMTCKPTHQSQR